MRSPGCPMGAPLRCADHADLRGALLCDGPADFTVMPSSGRCLEAPRVGNATWSRSVWTRDRSSRWSLAPIVQSAGGGAELPLVARGLCPRQGSSHARTCDVTTRRPCGRGAGKATRYEGVVAPAPCSLVGEVADPVQPPRVPTARATSSRDTRSAAVAWMAMSTFARLVSGIVSVGPKALELVTDR